MNAVDTRGRVRRANAMLAIVAVLLGILVALVPPIAAPASAANAEDFQDGHIISDTLFFASGSMTATDVQRFLDSKVSNCQGTNGMPCLKDYYAQSTPQLEANAYCRAYPGGAMSAAQLIVAVSQACGISPKVLIVMLQKEQSLITSTAPTRYNYSAALGQGCPDGAPCDPAFAGFFYQVYGAAKQMQVYIKNPRLFGYQLGWNNILYQATPPDYGRVCGTKRVFIENDATRALYIYTPYTPNQASMNNLYGTGDFCSTYGNRNFWRIYTDWFGSTRIDVRGRINSTYAAFGGAKSWLGAVEGDFVCGLADSGCYRPYAHGRIYASDLTMGVTVAPAIQSAWNSHGAEAGAFGFPVAEAFLVAKGWMQSFRDGIAVLPDGRDAQFVAGPLGLDWLNDGALASPMGAPTSPQYCVLAANGCVQVFAEGWYYWSPASGAHYVTGRVLQAWSDRGSETGDLGYPLRDTARDSVGGGDWTQFQGGLLYVDRKDRVWALDPAGAAAYVDAKSSGNSLGAPIAERVGNAEPLVDSFPYAARSTVVFMIASNSMGVNFPSLR